MYLKNMLIIARKEFSDLISNWMILVVLAVLLITIIYEIFNFNECLGSSIGGLNSTYESYGNCGFYAVVRLFWTLAMYGAVVGIMIGSLSIANERHNNALSTLIVKPIFRDTIFNGKLIGSIAFLTFVTGLTVLFFTSGILILYGDSLSSFIGDYVSLLFVVFIFLVIYYMLFLSMSMLISLLIKNQAFAMIFCLIVVYLSELSQGTLPKHLASIFTGDMFNIMNQIINNLPGRMIGSVMTMFVSSGGSNAYYFILPIAVRLLLYILVIFFMSYIVFIRSDVV